MKKILLLIAAIIASLSASAQMEIITNSFRDYASGNKAVGGENGMGVTDMTAETIDWPYDQDGNEGTLALLYVYFENLAPDDVKKIGIAPSSNTYIVSKDYALINGRPTLKVFLLAGKNIDLTFNSQLGSTRLQSKDFTEKHVYEVGVRNKSSQNVNITTIPDGATVTFDGYKLAGHTPLTIPNVSMGDHTIAIAPANPQIANPIDERTITVTASQSAFHYDMFKTKNVNIIAVPYDSHLEVIFNNQTIAAGNGSVRIPDAPYERRYQIIGTNGTDKVEDQIFIDANTPTDYIVHVIGSTSMSFTAKQNNQEVSGAEIIINGKPEGKTPLTKLLPYGEYNIQASYNGYTATKKIKVNKNSKDLMLRIPNKKSTGYNPFDVDYRKRQWGIAVNYIHRYYNLKVNGKSTKINWMGEDGKSNGVQIGIVYQPYFGAGQGLSTGLFFQRTFGSADYDVPGSYNSSYSEKADFYENALYIPLQYQFRLPLHRNFSIAVNAGAALTYGMANKLTYGDPKETIDLGYGDGFPDKLDYSLLFGAAIQFKALQLEAKYSTGLKDHSKEFQSISGTTDKVSLKSSFISVGLSLIF